MLNKEIEAFSARLEAIFEKLPHLPKGIVRFLVKIMPWLALIGGIMMILGGVAAIGLFMVRSILNLISGVILVLAFKPLRARESKGWMYMFWVAIIGLVEVVFVLVTVSGVSFVGALVWQIIGFYLLFEMKKSYK